MSALINSNTGQILRGSSAGEDLYNMVKHPLIKTIVDIGTWKGMGSTKCVLDGILDGEKRFCEVFSIEANEIFHEQAKGNLGFLPPNFHLLYGSLIKPEDLFQWKGKLPERETGWLNEDIANIKKCPNVLDKIPKQIDLLIIDGGEFSGEIEFNLLKERSTYFFMDDTNSYKNRNTRLFVLEHPEMFYVIKDSNSVKGDGNSRDYLICRKINDLNK